MKEPFLSARRRDVCDVPEGNANRVFCLPLQSEHGNARSCVAVRSYPFALEKNTTPLRNVRMGEGLRVTSTVHMNRDTKAKANNYSSFLESFLYPFSIRRLGNAPAGRKRRKRSRKGEEDTSGSMRKKPFLSSSRTTVMRFLNDE